MQLAPPCHVRHSRVASVAAPTHVNYPCIFASGGVPRASYGRRVSAVISELPAAEAEAEAVYSAESVFSASAAPHRPPLHRPPHRPPLRHGAPSRAAA